MTERTAGWSIGTAAAWLALGLLVLGFWGCPHYRVWQQGMSGQAKLREAEQSRLILVTEAEAKKEAAKALAAAEIERAKGVAEANKIIGAGLKNNEEYLIYLWIQTLGDKDNHVIYVPTETNLPILEAGRFQRLTKQPEPEAPAKKKGK